MAKSPFPQSQLGLVTQGPYKALGLLITNRDESLIIANTRYGEGCAPTEHGMANARLLASSFDLAVENAIMRDIIDHAKPLLAGMAYDSSMAANLIQTINETIHKV